MSDVPFLPRTLWLGLVGQDVHGVKRTVLRGLDQEDGGRRLKALESKALAVRRTFGPFFRTDVNRMRKLLGFLENGRVDETLWQAMARRGYPDAYAIGLINQYHDAHPVKLRLVEPVQGWDSLVRSLWPLYSAGRNMGFTDQGTYNGASRLPSGARSDHAVYPARAFDLGFTPPLGYANQRARTFFHMAADNLAVEYVICGDQIWSREKGQHDYIYGGHEGHIHVSGRHDL